MAPPNPPDEQLLTPREVAEMFGVRTTTIARWAREGRLTPLRTPGGHRRYTRECVLGALTEAEAEPEADIRLAEDAARLYAQGWSIRQVAGRFGWNYGRTRRVLLTRVSLRGKGQAAPPG